MTLRETVLRLCDRTRGGLGRLPLPIARGSALSSWSSSAYRRPAHAIDHGERVIGHRIAAPCHVAVRAAPARSGAHRARQCGHRRSSRPRAERRGARKRHAERGGDPARRRRTAAARSRGRKNRASIARPASQRMRRPRAGTGRRAIFHDGIGPGAARRRCTDRRRIVDVAERGAVGEIDRCLRGDDGRAQFARARRALRAVLGDLRDATAAAGRA